MAESLVALFSGIILYLNTIGIEFLLGTPPVFKTVKMDKNPFLVHGFDLVEKIKYAPVVWWKGDIMTNDMQVLFH
jgi:hypothetical protein